MVNNKGVAILIMIWITVLSIWAVNSLTSILSNLYSVNVSGIPYHPIEEPISTVRIDENTVWIINANNSNYIKVITQDEDGFKITEYEMQFQERQALWISLLDYLCAGVAFCSSFFVH
ncbi:hypothetical protein [Paenibacillus thermotolerans]|uniref:hypothetical protein n=1 Tax=Paenibacillus thermotolerans TaxID=3027807 RepID=UPI002367C78C|nr:MULTISPECIES: hypothetical protein [unclassified Paenibacillus]